MNIERTRNALNGELDTIIKTVTLFEENNDATRVKLNDAVTKYMHMLVGNTEDFALDIPPAEPDSSRLNFQIAVRDTGSIEFTVFNIEVGQTA